MGTLPLGTQVSVRVFSNFFREMNTDDTMICKTHIIDLNGCQAQEGLRAANDRFNGEVMRMNTDVANAEDALEKSVKECK